MVTPTHTRLVQALAAVERAPEAPNDLSRWLDGAAHLELLRRDLEGDELIVAALSSGHTCINSYVVPANLPEIGEDILSLYDWSPNPFHHTAASYSWADEGDRLRAVRRDDDVWSRPPAGVSPLVFFRAPEGSGSGDSISREIAQDFVHASGIHWRRDRRAYSRLDLRGDWTDIVSRTIDDESAGADLFSARREWIDLHLVALDAVLVRVFEFVLKRPSLPGGFDFRDHVAREVRDDLTLQYRELVSDGNFTMIDGVQVIRPRLSPREVEQLVSEGGIRDPSESEPVDFTVLDIRNSGVVQVSTDPSSTTNYYEARHNSLPFDTSPAFFRPEVLARYQADGEKYTVREHWITCRALWNLDYSVNDAAQVAVYICDLRMLPHEEQMYWSIFNEPPQAGLSDRAILTDFLGQWPEDATPREKLVITLQRWSKSKVAWWTWHAEGAPELLVVPRTGSRDEWARAVGALSNGVVEGFVVKELRRTLRDEGTEFDKEWKSIALLERILAVRGIAAPDGRLTFLREVREGRNVSGVHATGVKKHELATTILDQHGTYAAHFEYLCEGLANELALVEQALGGLEDQGPPRAPAL